ncbi:hypothetical protein GGQ81_002877 [Sphingomonas desiccabilis]|nr:hypothetical protein [Sphingomonas desiccabilis]
MLARCPIALKQFFEADWIDLERTSAKSTHANTDFGMCVIRHARSASPDATT